MDNVQPIPTVGQNYQEGIPQQQQDPTIPQNDHYLPNGDLTIESLYDYATKIRSIKKVPITSIPTLLSTTTNQNETNLVNSDEIELSPSVYKPAHPMFLPSIAHFIGSVINGDDIDQKYLESMLVCCQAYLDGVMEILESGFFRYLNQRRDGLNRRYSKLCMCVYYTISEELYKPLPGKTISDIEIQSLIQDLIQDRATSMYVKLNKFRIDNHDYDVTKTAVSKWLHTTPWHAIIYNSQAPLTFKQFLEMFFKIYTLYGGKEIRYIDTYPNEISTQSILPNSDLFVRLNPENTNSYSKSINNNIPLRIARLIRYLVHSESEDDPLQWYPYTEDDEYIDDGDSQDQSIDDNEEDDSALA